LSSRPVSNIKDAPQRLSRQRKKLRIASIGRNRIATGHDEIEARLTTATAVIREAGASGTAGTAKVGTKSKIGIKHSRSYFVKILPNLTKIKLLKNSSESVNKFPR
jgi:hypothetical protein